MAVIPTLNSSVLFQNAVFVLLVAFLVRRTCSLLRAWDLEGGARAFVKRNAYKLFLASLLPSLLPAAGFFFFPRLAVHAGIIIITLVVNLGVVLIDSNAKILNSCDVEKEKADAHDGISTDRQEHEGGAMYESLVELFRTSAEALKGFLHEWVVEVRILASQSPCQAILTLLVPSLFLAVAFIVSPTKAIILCLATACVVNISMVFVDSYGAYEEDEEDNASNSLASDNDLTDGNKSGSCLGVGQEFLNEWAAELHTLDEESPHLLPSLLISLAYFISPSVALIFLLINVGVTHIFNDGDNVEDDDEERTDQKKLVDVPRDNGVGPLRSYGAVSHGKHNHRLDNHGSYYGACESEGDHTDNSWDDARKSHERDDAIHIADYASLSIFYANHQDGDHEQTPDKSYQDVLKGNKLNGGSDGTSLVVEYGSSAHKAKVIGGGSRPARLLNLSDFITNDYMMPPADPVDMVSAAEDFGECHENQAAKRWELVSREREMKLAKKAAQRNNGTGGFVAAAKKKRR